MIDDTIVALGEDIADMGRRIQNSGGELHYSAEKAYRAAKDAVRIMAAAHAASDVSADDRDLFGELSRVYETERRWAALGLDPKDTQRLAHAAELETDDA